MTLWTPLCIPLSQQVQHKGLPQQERARLRVAKLQICFPGRFDLACIGCFVAGQRRQQDGQSTLRVRHHRYRSIQLDRLEFRNIDVYELCLIFEEPLGGGREVRIAGADTDDQIRFLQDADRPESVPRDDAQLP